MFDTLGFLMIVGVSVNYALSMKCNSFVYISLLFLIKGINDI